MFEGSFRLKSLDLSNFRTDKVTTMNGMFRGCDLTSLDISNFSTQSVTDMDLMFYNTSFLSSYNLPVFDMSNVATAQGMFANSKIDAVKLNKSNLKSDINLKAFIYDSQSMNLTVRSSQDKALFGNLSNTRLNITVSTN